MVYTDSFLCCFDLEIGGIIVGLLGIVVNVLSLFIVPVYFFNNRSPKIHPFFDLTPAYPPNYIPYNDRSTRSIPDNGMLHNVALSLGVGVGMLILVVIIVNGIILLRLWASISLLNGTKKRNHKQVLIYVIIDGIFMTLCLITSFIIHPLYILDYFMIYSSICTYSLYKKLQIESMQRTNMELASVDTVLHPSK